jgi:cation-transporting ATPase 13A3/4/5
MSVICEIGSKQYVFVKGSPEKIEEISMKDSICENYSEIVNKYSIKGFRIIGFGYKEL